MKSSGGARYGGGVLACGVPTSWSEYGQVQSHCVAPGVASDGRCVTHTTMPGTWIAPQLAIQRQGGAGLDGSIDSDMFSAVFDPALVHPTSHSMARPISQPISGGGVVDQRDPFLYLVHHVCRSGRTTRGRAECRGRPIVCDCASYESRRLESVSGGNSKRAVAKIRAKPSTVDRGEKEGLARIAKSQDSNSVPHYPTMLIHDNGYGASKSDIQRSNIDQGFAFSPLDWNDLARAQHSTPTTKLHQEYFNFLSRRKSPI